ncbi:MAG: hypothetical protein O3A40_08530 [Bacteroidetes bacterium]|nr:hypothetical protein [Bacteroidota bacterium]
MIFTSGNMITLNAVLGPKTSLNGISGNFTVQTTSDLRSFNYSLKAASGTIRVGSSSGTKTLELNNNASTWIKGKITSGNITIGN